MTRAARQRRHPLADLGRTAPAQDRVAYLTDRWRRWRGLEGEGAFSRRRRAGHPGHAVRRPRRYRGRLAAVAPVAGSRARDTINVLQPRELPQGRRPARDAGARGARPRSGPRRSRRAPTRRTSAHHRTGAAVRHHLLPGVRRVRRRAPRLQRRGRRRPRSRVLTAPGRAGVHPVRLQQRRLDLGRVDALPARPRRTRTTAGPATPCTPGRRAVSDTVVEARLAGDRQPDAGSRSTERDGNGEWGGRVGSVRLVGSRGPGRRSAATRCARSWACGRPGLRSW